jgi:hypothetical protein
MAEGRKHKETGAGSAHPPPFSAKRFESSPEFANFKAGMKKLLAVSKAEMDERVRHAKEASPRAGNPKAAGRKKKNG